MTNSSCQTSTMLSDTRHIHKLILCRLQAEGQSSTPRLIRRFLESQLNLPGNSLDPHRKLVNRMIKAVLKDRNLMDSVNDKEDAVYKESRAPAPKVKSLPASPKRKNTQYYNVLRRICFTVKLNPNRLGLGGKDPAEKLEIITEALVDTGFSREQLHISNVEETLEMAEVERDRRELAEATPVVKSRLRKRTTENYESFFVDHASASDSSSDRDADDDDDSDGALDAGSEFSGVESSESEEEEFFDSPDDQDKKPKKPKRKTKKKGKKTSLKGSTITSSKVVKKSNVVSSDADEVEPLPPRKRSRVRYIDSEDCTSEDSSDEKSQKRRRSAAGSDEESFACGSDPYDTQ